VLDRPDVPNVSVLVYLLALDADERRNHDDLAGAWEDIVAMFQIAHQLGDEAWFTSAVLGVERNALDKALEWAVARGQTPERLQKALAVYRDLPKIPAVADMIRAESSLVENALELPTSTLRDWVFEAMSRGTGSQRVFDALLFDLATMPWERVRARRLNRLMSHAAIQAAMREPWQRPRVSDPEIEYAQQTSRTAMLLFRVPAAWYVSTADQNEVVRRALVQVMALRKWQLEHGGQFPKTLDALVPAELPRLPLDPYSGRPFGYVPSHQQEVPALKDAFFGGTGNAQVSAPESWLLYSVGPEGHNDGGITFFRDKSRGSKPLDIVFAIPPVKGEKGATKTQEGGQDSGKGRPPK
jgi:hypothetical protein